MSDKEFQSTLPRGERRYRHYMQRGDIIFQSTLPRGERHSVIYPKLPYITISIHAPARGATWSNFFQMFTYKLFQSTLPRGERPSCLITFTISSKYFNPRSREGSDLYTFDFLTCNHDFNPRSREGSDILQAGLKHHSMGISIHAPARGAT